MINAVLRKLSITLLAFLLGLAVFWMTGGFSHSTHYVEQSAPAAVFSHHIEQTAPQTDPIQTENVLDIKDLPRFQDFLVDKIYKGKFAPLKLKDNDLGYKIRLEMALEDQEVDFAGHYVATSWSCGMWCSVNAFIDAKTGKVYWSPVSTEVCLPHLQNDFVCDESFSNFEYKVDSKLIVFFGFSFQSDLDEGEKGFHYYKF